jgi:hypothetical protein
MNPAGLAPSHPSDPESAFDRDTFLLRQKALSISEKYTVSDETGAAVLHVVRPAMALRNIAALLAALVGVLLSFVAAAAAAFGLVADRSPLQPIVFIVVLVAGIVGSVVLAVVLSPKRHVKIHDRARGEGGGAGGEAGSEAGAAQSDVHGARPRGAAAGAVQEEHDPQPFPEALADL